MRCGSGREYTRRRETGAIGDVHTHAVNRVSSVSCGDLFAGPGGHAPHRAAGSPPAFCVTRIRLPQLPRAIFFLLLVGPKATPQRPPPRPAGPAAVAAAGPQRVRTAVAAQWWHEQRGWRWSVARCRHLHTHRRLASPVRAPRAQSPRTSLHRPRRRRPGRCGHRDSAAATREPPRSTRGG